MPLPLSMRTCRYGRQLDMFGHHRAACAVAGVVAKLGFPLEGAAAQVCREAGARVSTNIPVRDMDLAAHNNLGLTSLGAGPRRCTTGDRHDVGVAFATRRFCQVSCSRP